MKRIFHLLRLIVPPLLIGILVLAVAVFIYLPRLVEVSPLDGSLNVAAGEPLRLRFSRPMNTAEVEQRLVIEPDVPGQTTWDGDTLVFTPADPWPAGAEVRVELLPGARPAEFPPLPIQTERVWTFSVRRPRLAFLYPSDGPANITVRDPVSGEDQPLTDVPAGVQDFTVGPDGAFLYYSARESQGGSNLYRLDLSNRFTLAPEGGELPAPAPPELIVACAPADCRAPVVSLDGDYLAYERTEAPQAERAALPQVWWLPLRLPGEPSRLGEPAQPGESAPAGDPAHETLLPAWSPDGRLAFYDRQAQAFILKRPGEDGEIRLANTTGQPGAWQPDGTAFLAPEINFLDVNVSDALREQLNRLADSHLILYPASDSATVDLTREEGIEDAIPVYSPDGRFFAFARKFLDSARWSPGRQLWVMDVTTRQGRPLTNEPDFNHFDFAWNPDGRQLAYVRFDQSMLIDPPEIWVMDVNSGETTQITVGGYSPQWIP